MIVTPAATIAGSKIVETLGLVRGNTIRARNVGKDIVAVIKNLVGGEIEEYTKMMGEAREQALSRMLDQAAVTVDLLHGRLRMPIGGVWLARLTGSPIIPVFVTRTTVTSLTAPLGSIFHFAVRPSGSLGCLFFITS